MYTFYLGILILLGQTESARLEAVAVELQIQIPDVRQSRFWDNFTQAELPVDYGLCEGLMDLLSQCYQSLAQTVLFCSNKPYELKAFSANGTVQIYLIQGEINEKVLEAWRIYWSTEVVPNLNHWLTGHINSLSTAAARVLLLDVVFNHVQNYELEISIENALGTERDISYLSNLCKINFFSFLDNHGIRDALTNYAVLSLSENFFSSAYTSYARASFDYGAMVQTDLRFSDPNAVFWLNGKLAQFANSANKNRSIKWTAEMTEKTNMSDYVSAKFTRVSKVRRNCSTDSAQVVSLVFECVLRLHRNENISRTSAEQLFTTLIDGVRKFPWIRYIYTNPLLDTPFSYRAEFYLMANESMAFKNATSGFIDTVDLESDLRNRFNQSGQISEFFILDTFMQTHEECAPTVKWYGLMASKSVRFSIPMLLIYRLIILVLIQS